MDSLYCRGHRSRPADPIKPIFQAQPENLCNKREEVETRQPSLLKSPQKTFSVQHSPSRRRGSFLLRGLSATSTHAAPPPFGETTPSGVRFCFLSLRSSKLSFTLRDRRNRLRFHVRREEVTSAHRNVLTGGCLVVRGWLRIASNTPRSRGPSRLTPASSGD